MVVATDMSEPTTFQEAVSGPDQVHWRDAIRAELKSMRLRGVFRAAKLPAGQRAIGTKWVFKIKRNADGSINKYKARLVAKGFKQKYGIDYTETFAPVVKYVTLRIVIALAKFFGWPVDQLDVVTAFLYGEMKELVFILVPEGMESRLRLRLPRAAQVDLWSQASVSRLERDFRRVSCARSALPCPTSTRVCTSRSSMITACCSWCTSTT